MTTTREQKVAEVRKCLFRLTQAIEDLKAHHREVEIVASVSNRETLGPLIKLHFGVSL
jgi:hypothetical protein